MRSFVPKTKKPRQEAPLKKQQTQSRQTVPLAVTIQRAQSAPETLTHQHVLQLQSSIGNRAVEKLLKGTGKHKPQMASAYETVMQLLKSASSTFGVIQMGRDIALIGTELTFTNSALYEAWRESNGDIANDTAIRLIDAWNEHMTGETGPFAAERIETDKGYGYKYTFEENGWWYQITMDAGTLETQVKPFTQEQLRGTVGEYIETYIYGTAKALGLKADKLVGGGHINLDVGTSFDGNPEIFKNFLVLYDHLFEIMKTLDDDQYARSFCELEGEAPQTWKYVLSRFRSGETSIFDFAKLIRENVHTKESLDPELLGRIENRIAQLYVEETFHKDDWESFQNYEGNITYDSVLYELEGDERAELQRRVTEKAWHNQALNVQHIKGEEGDRLELRRFSAQPSLEVLKREVELVLQLLDMAGNSEIMEDLEEMDWTKFMKEVKGIKTILKQEQSNILDM